MGSDHRPQQTEDVPRRWLRALGGTAGSPIVREPGDSGFAELKTEARFHDQPGDRHR